jgi:hypothetical protein
MKESAMRAPFLFLGAGSGADMSNERQRRLVRSLKLHRLHAVSLFLCHRREGCSHLNASDRTQSSFYLRDQLSFWCLQSQHECLHQVCPLPVLFHLSLCHHRQ